MNGNSLEHRMQWNMEYPTAMNKLHSIFCAVRLCTRYKNLKWKTKQTNSKPQNFNFNKSICVCVCTGVLPIEKGYKCKYSSDERTMEQNEKLNGESTMDRMQWLLYTMQFMAFFQEKEETTIKLKQKSYCYEIRFQLCFSQCMHAFEWRKINLCGYVVLAH